MTTFPRARAGAAVVALLALISTLMVAVTTGANASSNTMLDVLVSEDPVGWTPHLTGTRVVAIDTASDVVAAGGLFTAARVPGGSNVAYSNFVLFQHGTGNLLPSPSFDKEIYAVEAAADGQSFYVAGKFKNVNGQQNKGLVRVALDGTIVDTWNANVDWAVNDITLVGDVLYIGGNFNKVNNTNRDGLAALDAETGDLLDWNPSVTDPYSTSRTVGARSIEKIDTTPDGTRMVVIGNFAKIDGTTRERVAMFDIMGPTITLANWRAVGFEAQCPANKWPMWIRDMDISPTGDFVVFGTTGAYGNPTGSQRLCDTVSRFELHSTGNVDPTWRSYTGGDTTYGVAATDDVVYAGGHMRWMNNPYAADREGAGAVDRFGITAIDSRTGVPLEWNPRRDPRGFGTYELIAGDDGLWVGQDTGNIGGEYHSLIAMLPTAGGRAIARPNAGNASDGVLRIDNSSLVEQVLPGVGATGDYTSVSFDPTKVLAATAIGDDLMVALNDATLNLVADGGTGAVTTLDLNGLIGANWFRVGSLTSLFYDAQTSWIYYTRAGSTTLRGRGYSPDSGVVEALEFSISSNTAGYDWDEVVGAWIDGDTLYVGRNDGSLEAIGWTATGPTGGRTVVGGPKVDGVDYDVRALSPVATGGIATNRAPIAVLDVQCVDTTCWVDGGDSRDPDGHIKHASIKVNGVEYATSTGAKIELPGEGSWTIDLAITDDDGASAGASASAQTFAAPIAAFSAACDGLTCTFDASGSTDGQTPGVGIVSYDWDLGDGNVAAGVTVVHTYAEDIITTVGLTVTDDEGLSTATSQEVTAVAPLDGVTFLGANGSNRWSTAPTTTVPDTVRDGTLAILEVTSNKKGELGSVITGPGTWTELGRQDTGGSSVAVWWAILNEVDMGADVTAEMFSGRKTDISLSLYGGVDVTNPIAGVAFAKETLVQKTHTTPTLETVEETYVVSIWTDKTGSSTVWTPPAGDITRYESHGTGSGRIGVLISDAEVVAPAGTVGGLTATSGGTNKNATMWTIALRGA